MGKVKILFFAADSGLTTSRLKPLQLNEEIRAITEKIRAAEYRNSIELVPALSVRPDDLLQTLNEHKPQIVHFGAHGKPTGELLLLDKFGFLEPVSTNAIQALFETLRDNIRVVILNACYSKPQAQAINKVIDCVIGMRTAISDQAAITFAASFYRAIGFGRSVKEAFEQGKAALLLEGIAEENTPELLARKGVDPMRIFILEATSPEPELISKEPGGFEGKGRRGIGIQSSQSSNSNLNSLSNYCELSYDEVTVLKKCLSLLVVTATNIETQTLHQQIKPLPGCSGLIKVPHKSQTYYLGVFGIYGVAHVQCEMGSISRGGSISTVSEAIDVWKPKAVLMCGIAFGVDKESQIIGDVLVSDGIIPYNIQRVGKEEIVHRNPIPRAGSLLFNRFKNAIDWDYTLPRKRRAKIIPGYILSGESLIDNIEYRDSLRGAFPNARGGEMEGAGLYAAADNKSLQWIVVKGICDFADGCKSKNKSQNQKIAAQSSISLCLKVLSTPTGFKELGFVPITEWKGLDENNIKDRDKVSREEEENIEAEEENKKPGNSNKDSTNAKQIVNIEKVETFINKF